MKNFCIILVEPKNAFNIGSICRSMANFGITDLRLVNPRIDYLCNNVKKIAIKSFHLLKQAKNFSSLVEAIADSDFIFGTTRRFGKHRTKQYFSSPKKAAEMALSISNVNKIAYVFGREDIGLSNEELRLCNTYVYIPTSSIRKSINLSHAVSICLYEIQNEYKKSSSLLKNNNIKVPNKKNMFRMVSNMNKALLSIGYLTNEDYDHISNTITKIFIRSKMSIRELKIIQGLWSRINWIAKKKKNTKMLWR